MIDEESSAIIRLFSFFFNSSFFLNSSQILFFCLSGTSRSYHLKKLHFLLTKYFPQPWNLLPGFSSIQAVTNGESTPQWQTTLVLYFNVDPLTDEDEYPTIFSFLQKFSFFYVVCNKDEEAEGKKEIDFDLIRKKKRKMNGKDEGGNRTWRLGWRRRWIELILQIWEIGGF